jgi:site-specific DNA-cytosine methylase
VSLFAGIGGFDVALEAHGISVVPQVVSAILTRLQERGYL